MFGNIQGKICLVCNGRKKIHTWSGIHGCTGDNCINCIVCHCCNGIGKIEEKYMLCPGCYGRGKHHNNPIIHCQKWCNICVNCTTCNGRGIV